MIFSNLYREPNVELSTKKPAFLEKFTLSENTFSEITIPRCHRGPCTEYGISLKAAPWKAEIQDYSQDLIVFLEFGRIPEATPAGLGCLCTAQVSRSSFSKVLIQPAELAPRNLVEGGGGSFCCCRKNKKTHSLWDLVWFLQFEFAFLSRMPP